MQIDDRVKALEKRLETKLVEAKDIMLDFAKVLYKQEKEINVLQAQLSKLENKERIH